MGATRLYIKDAAELLEWQLRIREATGRQDVACVIGAWMAGIPSASVAERIRDDINATYGANPTAADKAYYIATAALWLYGKAFWSAVGNAVYGDRIWTIEDECPNGPSVDDALGVLKDADPDLWAQVTGLGQKQRAAVAVQANETAKEQLGRDVINAAKFAADGLTSFGSTAVKLGGLALAAYVLFNVKKLFGGKDG